MSVTIKLRKPIHVLGDMVNEITLREPRGKDIAACGIPEAVLVRGSAVKIEVDAASVHAYIGELAGIPNSSVDQMTAPDWTDAKNAVLSFFSTAAGKTDPAAGDDTARSADENQKGIPMPFQDGSTAQTS